MLNGYIVLFRILGIFIFVLGLSIAIYKDRYKALVDELTKSKLAQITAGIVPLLIGSVLINFFNVWELNLDLILTISAYLILFAGIFRLLLPNLWLKIIAKQKNKIPFRICGIAFSIVGLILLYFGYF